MMKKRTHSPYLLLGIIMLGAVMRAPFTAVPAILTDMAAGLGVPVSSLGILTSLPLIMFATCSALAPKWAGKLGIEKLLGLVLLLMAVGSFMRIINVPLLYLGTILVGLAVAVINVLLPSLISANTPHKLGLYTTIYLVTMGLASTLAAMIAVPITAATSWQFFVLLLTILVLVAVLVWLPNLRYNHRFENTESATASSSVWKNKSAWILLFFAGLQCMLFYTELTWLPTIAQSAGLSKSDAGIVAGVFNLISIPISMIIPSVLAKLKNEQRARLMAIISLATLIGLGLMALMPASFAMWNVIATLLGGSCGALFPYMMLTFTLKTSNSQDTARLSGMVQSGGYLLAAVGPLVLGYSDSLFHSWLPLIIVLAIVTILMIWTILQIEKEDKIL